MRSNFTNKLELLTEAWKHTECFAVVILAEWVNTARGLSIIRERDFDVLEESLGNIYQTNSIIFITTLIHW